MHSNQENKQQNTKEQRTATGKFTEGIQMTKKNTPFPTDALSFLPAVR
jgi:hypothetical protein